MRAKHLITHKLDRKLNSTIYTLQKWIKRNRMYTLSQAWKTENAHKSANKKAKTEENPTIRKPKLKQPFGRIRRTDEKFRKITRNYNNYATNGTYGKQNISRGIQQNGSKRNIREVWKRINEQQPQIKKTKRAKRK